MTDTAPELSAASVIANLKARAYPPEAVATIARGFLPLPQEDLIAVLAYLIENGEPQISALARAALDDVPARIIVSFAQNDTADPERLELLGCVSRDRAVLEALIRNKAVSDHAITELARRAEPGIQEIIVINQLRIIRTPAILDALLENPQLSPDARRRALETREEFFEKKARLQKIAEELADEELLKEVPLDPIADLLEQAEQQSEAAPPQAELPPSDADDPKKKAIWMQIVNMTVSEKVQLAFKGDKTVRMILVRERNRLVCTATMRNPRMTENEAEAIAGMRNVEEEVLRIVGSRRDWMSKYPIMIALCRNPKVPVGVVLPLINRLALRDLKALKDDRGVSEVVRTSARKLYQMRQKM